MTMAAQEFGYFYKEIVCNRNVSIQYVMRFVQGAVLAGAWVGFYEFEEMDGKVLGNVLEEVKKYVKKL